MWVPDGTVLRVTAVGVRCSDLSCDDPRFRNWAQLDGEAAVWEYLDFRSDGDNGEVLPAAGSDQRGGDALWCAGYETGCRATMEHAARVQLRTIRWYGLIMVLMGAVNAVSFAFRPPTTIASWAAVSVLPLIGLGLIAVTSWRLHRPNKRGGV